MGKRNQPRAESEGPSGAGSTKKYDSESPEYQRGEFSISGEEQSPEFGTEEFEKPKEETLRLLWASLQTLVKDRSHTLPPLAVEYGGGPRICFARDFDLKELNLSQADKDHAAIFVASAESRKKRQLDPVAIFTHLVRHGNVQELKSYFLYYDGAQRSLEVVANKPDAAKRRSREFSELLLRLAEKPTSASGFLEGFQESLEWRTAIMKEREDERSRRPVSEAEAQKLLMLFSDLKAKVVQPDSSHAQAPHEGG